MALLERFISPNDAQIDPAPTRIRRCAFRRVTAVPRQRSLPVYDVACYYPDYSLPVPLGDLDTARSACNGCNADGIFRPDSD